MTALERLCGMPPIPGHENGLDKALTDLYVADCECGAQFEPVGEDGHDVLDPEDPENTAENVAARLVAHLEAAR